MRCRHEVTHGQRALVSRMCFTGTGPAGDHHGLGLLQSQDSQLPGHSLCGELGGMAGTGRGH